jgi:hypothetical protein
MKTVSEIQKLTASEIQDAAKTGMTEDQMKGYKVAKYFRRIVSDPEVLKVFRDREAILAAFERIASLPNDGQKSVSYTDEFISSLKNAILKG